MSDLMNTAEGREALLVAQRYLLERRLSRFFKRNTAIEIDKYRNGGVFELAGMLGQLNVENDDEIIDIYRLLGSIGALGETFANMTIYVDQQGTNPVPGNDIMGDGSAAAPYQSLWFLHNLPRRINHHVQIVFLSSYADLNLDIVIDNTFGSNRPFGGTLGCLSFIGRGAPTIISGPYEIQAKGSTDGGDLTHDTIQTTVPLAGDMSPYFVRYLSCTNPLQEQKACPVIAQPDVDILIVPHLAALLSQVGDTFDVVTPSIGLDVRSITCNQLGGTRDNNGIADNGATVAFCNLALRVDAAGLSTADALKINSPSPTLISFVRFRGRARINSELNTVGSNDITIVTTANAGVKNINNTLSGSSGGRCGIHGYDANNYVVLEGRAYMRDVYMTLGQVIMTSGAPYMIDCSVRNISCQYGNPSADYMYFAGEAGGFAISISWSVFTGYSGVCMGPMLDIIQVYEQGGADIGLIGVEQTYGDVTGYSIRARGQTQIALPFDPAKMSATTGDIRWETTNPATVQAFPGTYAAQTDGLGSYVARRNN